MEKKLYVGGLNYETTQEAVEKLFAEAGTVEEAAIIMDRDRGDNTSKGFGFVTMATEEEAKKAIEMFNGYDLEGRKLIVNEARPRVDRPAGGGYDRGGGQSHGRY